MFSTFENICTTFIYSVRHFFVVLVVSNENYSHTPSLSLSLCMFVCVSVCLTRTSYKSPFIQFTSQEVLHTSHFLREYSVHL